MRILICDDVVADADEILETIKSYMQDNAFEYKIVNPDELIDLIESDDFLYDIAVMDIMFSENEENGIQMSKKINDRYPYCHIIFVTSILEFAPDVYETEHVYFVLKENQKITLPLALKKAIEIQKKDEDHASLEITADGKKQILMQRDIIYIERCQRATKIVTVDKEYNCYIALDKIVEKLNDSFVRCYNGFIVHLSKVKSTDKKIVTMIDGTEIPIGPSHKEQFMSAYLAYLSDRM